MTDEDLLRRRVLLHALAIDPPVRADDLSDSEAWLWSAGEIALLPGWNDLLDWVRVERAFPGTARAVLAWYRPAREHLEQLGVTQVALRLLDLRPYGRPAASVQLRARYRGRAYEGAHVLPYYPMHNPWIAPEFFVAALDLALRRLHAEIFSPRTLTSWEAPMTPARDMTPEEIRETWERVGQGFRGSLEAFLAVRTPDHSPEALRDLAGTVAGIIDFVDPGALEDRVRLEDLRRRFPEVARDALAAQDPDAGGGVPDSGSGGGA